MYKKILKYLGIVCAVLAIGQIEINQRTLGNYFVVGVKTLGIWTAEKVVESPWVAKVARPKGLTQWFPVGEMKRKPLSVKETRAGIGASDLASSEVDEEQEVEDGTQNDDEFSEVELEADDTAVMSILP